MKNIIFLTSISVILVISVFFFKKDTHIITIGDTGFSPSVTTIGLGSTVIFKNISNQDRWPASDIHPSHQIYPEFDPKKPIPPKQSWSFTFDKPGEWKFHDHISPKLTGSIIVKGEKNKHLKVQNKKSPIPDPSKGDNSLLGRLDAMAYSKDKEKIKELLLLVGPTKLMEDLLNDSGNGSTFDCHQEAHNIGNMAYALFGQDAFGEGGSSCHSGYYHGAMEIFLQENGTTDLALKIDNICSKFETYFGKFECLHGVGHGLLAFQEYDLPKSLETCQLLKGGFSISSCYGGVFMENIIAGQDLGASETHETKWVNKSDPHFPCNAVSQDPETQIQCYQMQTSWMLTIYNYDYDKVTNECFKASEDMVPVCFRSLGRDIAGNTLRDPLKIIKHCDKVPTKEDYYDECIKGALNVIVDFWGDNLNNQASALCKLLPETNKDACYTILAGRMSELFIEKSKYQLACETFEEKYKNKCL